MRTVKLTQPDAWRQMPPTGALRPWLTNRGSLTAQIVARATAFNLVRLSQQRTKANVDERRAMGLNRGELAMVREVLLRDSDAALVFAHTVAAPQDLQGVWRGLSKLGARPLAEMLFGDAAVARMQMEYKLLPRAHPLMLRLHTVVRDAPCRAWARRSVFLKHGRPLLVTEVFLPSILKL
jgi:chorismate lyase